MEADALDLIGKVDALGGAVHAIEAGFQQREIEDSAYRHAAQMEDGSTIVVGVNRYVSGVESPPILAVDPALERDQVARLAALRERRDGAAVATALTRVSAVATGSDNLLYPMKEALGAGATVGEVSGALRTLFGSYRPA